MQTNMDKKIFFFLCGPLPKDPPPSSGPRPCGDPCFMVKKREHFLFYKATLRLDVHEMLCLLVTAAYLSH